MTGRQINKALALTSSTGAAGLMYEVAWHRYLSLLLGCQAKATALILAVFLGGLGCGYALFGVLAKRNPSPRLVSSCGLVEIGIGLWALLFLGLFRLASSLMIFVPETGYISLLGEAVITLALIGVPTLLMGGTLPLLTQGLAGASASDNARLHARIYAVNTGGAFLGCLTAGFLLLPSVGLSRTVVISAVINILAGVWLFRIGRSLKPSEQTAQESVRGDDSPGEGTISTISAIIVAFVVGVCALSVQTILIRLLAISMGASEYTFTMVVASYILLIALGAWVLVDRKQSRWPLWANQALLVVSLIVLYFGSSRF